MRNVCPGIFKIKPDACAVIIVHIIVVHRGVNAVEQLATSRAAAGVGTAAASRRVRIFAETIPADLAARDIYVDNITAVVRALSIPGQTVVVNGSIVSDVDSIAAAAALALVGSAGSTIPVLVGSDCIVLVDVSVVTAATIVRVYIAHNRVVLGRVKITDGQIFPDVIDVMAGAGLAREAAITAVYAIDNCLSGCRGVSPYVVSVVPGIHSAGQIVYSWLEVNDGVCDLIHSRTRIGRVIAWRDDYHLRGGREISPGRTEGGQSWPLAASGKRARSAMITVRGIKDGPTAYRGVGNGRDMGIRNGRVTCIVMCRVVTGSSGTAKKAAGEDECHSN